MNLTRNNNSLANSSWATKNKNSSTVAPTVEVLQDSNLAGEEDSQLESERDSYQDSEIVTERAIKKDRYIASSLKREEEEWVDLGSQIPKSLKRELDIYAATIGKQKRFIVEDALRRYLKKRLIK